MSEQAFTQYRSGQLAAAAGNYAKAIEIAGKLGADDPHVAFAKIRLARVVLAQGHADAAAKLYVEATNALKAALDSKSPVIKQAYCDALAGLAEADEKAGKNEEAETQYQQALVFADSASLGHQLNDLSFAYQKFLLERGRARDALALKDEAGLRAAAAAPLPGGEEASYQIDSHRRKAEQAAAKRDWAAAELEYKRALAIADRANDRLSCANLATDLGKLYARQDKSAQAERAFSVALSQYKIVQAASVLRRAALCGAIMSLTRLNKSSAALPLAQQLVSDSREIKSEDQHELIDALNILGTVALGAGDKVQSQVAFRESAKLAARPPKTPGFSGGLTRGVR